MLKVENIELTALYRLGQLSPMEFQQRTVATIAFSRAGELRSWKFLSTVIESSVADD